MKIFSAFIVIVVASFLAWSILYRNDSPSDQAPSSSSQTMPSITAQDMLGTWKPRDRDDIYEQYSVEPGKNVYRSFTSGTLVFEGEWSLDDSENLTIRRDAWTHMFRVKLNAAKDEITYVDGTTEIVYVKVK